MLRKITSFVMLYAFIVMVLSGITLFISPFGRLSMMIKWEFLWLDKMQWQGLHLIFMLIFTIAGLLHIFYNIKAIKNYLKSKTKKMVVLTTPHIVSIVIVATLFVLTINKVEPLQTFVKMNKSFNDYWMDEFKEKRMKEMMKMRGDATQ